MGDMSRVIREAVAAYGEQRPCWLVTVTAPGVDRLPWDAEEPGRVELHAANAWNASARPRWSQGLHHLARTRTARAGHRLNVLAMVWQMQARGVLHVHLILGYDGPDREAARFYVKQLRELAPRYDFGYIDARDIDGKRRATVMPGWRAANYVSRYLSESTQFLDALAAEHRPKRLWWVRPELTSRSGVTMRRLRRARYLYVINSWPKAIYYRRAALRELPAWLADPWEYLAVAALLTAPNAP